MTKSEARKAGKYVMPAPPVYTGHWDDADWIAFIDNWGRWTVVVTG